MRNQIARHASHDQRPSWIGTLWAALKRAAKRLDRFFGSISWKRFHACDVPEMTFVRHKSIALTVDLVFLLHQREYFDCADVASLAPFAPLLTSFVTA